MNPDIDIVSTEILSDNWYVLRKISYRMRRSDGTWVERTREAYDRGNGATILLYDLKRRTVLLTRQFRLPTYVNGNDSGMLLETCAGLLDADNPEDCIRRETREETGYEIRDVRKVFEAYMSPGSVTEILYFFVAEYSAAERIGEGGGIDDEDIEVVEMGFDAALEAVRTGTIRDAKTIMLLQYAALHLFGR